MPVRSITMVVGSCYSQVARVTTRLLRLLLRLGCEESRARMLVVASGELVTNIIEHGYREEPGGDIVVEVRVDEAEVHLRVRDRGRPVPPDLLDRIRAPEVDPDDVQGLPEGGMGLYIARQFFEHLEWKTRDGWNVLTASAPLRGAAA